MSLDVYLTTKEKRAPTSNGIFVREHGSLVEISEDEWRERNPGQTPVRVETVEETDEVYWANITHNLNKMADAAGIYKHLWRPDEIGITKAAQLIEPLRAGLALLKSDRERFEKFNAPNGWGLYEHFVPFVEKYPAACEEYPDADVHVSR
jgi:hypothetical protein